jgi:hypothetical protein
LLDVCDRGSTSKRVRIVEGDDESRTGVATEARLPLELRRLGDLGLEVSERLAVAVNWIRT